MLKSDARIKALAHCAKPNRVPDRGSATRSDPLKFERQLFHALSPAKLLRVADPRSADAASANHQAPVGQWFTLRIQSLSTGSHVTRSCPNSSTTTNERSLCRRAARI